MQNKINAFLIFLGLIHSIVIGLNVPVDFCDGLYNETLPHPEHCTHFVYCLNESPYVFKCEPPKNVFYQDKCVAGDPESCEIFATTTSTTSTTSKSTTSKSTITSTPTTTTTESSVPNDICDGITNGILPHPNNCFQFVVCTNEIATIVNCGSAEIFYDGTCVEGDPLTCQIVRTTTIPDETTDLPTNEPTTTEKPLTTSSRLPTTTPIPVHRCPPSGYGYIPHHTNCSRYFECIRGIRHLRFCHEDLLFDSVTLQCTSPELAVCAGGQ